MNTPSDHTDNAFDFLRLSAAFAVLYSHSYALFGLPLPSPLPGQSFGSLAVYVFFAISGYLVCGSWERDPNFKRFWIRRAMRVLPGVVVAVIFTTFVVGSIMTSHPIGSYLIDYNTWAYFFSNATLIVGRFGLPGVFENNPFANAANASLWTLRYEVLMYLVLSILGIFSGKIYFRSICSASLFVFIALWFTEVIFKINHDFFIFQFIKKIAQPVFFISEIIGLTIDYQEFLNLGIFYFSGTFLYFHQRKIRSLTWMSVLFFILLIWMKNPTWVIPFLWIIIPCFSLIFSNNAPRFFKRICKNDYSYGVYIYAFPIQQITSFYFLKNHSVWFFSFITATILTYFLAFISWKVIEQPALRMKSKYLSNLNY